MTFLPYVASLILLGLSFFSFGSNHTETLTKVSLQLEWKHQFEFAGYYIAKEKGFYQQEGLDVEFFEYNSLEHKSVYQSLVNGSRDFGTTDVGVLNQKSNDTAQIVMLSNYFKRSAFALVTIPEITLPKDLKGRKVMIEQNDISGISISSLFNKFGITRSDIEAIPHSFDIEDFSSGKVHAMSIFQTNQIYDLRKKGIDYNLFDPSSYGLDIYGDSLFTSQRMIDNSPEVVESFKRASDKGWVYAMAHPDEVINIILKSYNSQGKSRQALNFEATETQRFVLPKVYDVGSIDLNKVNSMEKAFKHSGRRILFSVFTPQVKKSDNINESTSLGRKIKVQFDWKHQFQYAGFYAAKEKGYYSQYGLDVDFIEYDNDVSVVNSVVDGRVQFAVQDSDVIGHRLQGLPVVILSNYFKRSPYVIVSSSDINKPSDLKSKKLMIERRSVDGVAIGIMFKQNGLNDKNVTLVPQSFSTKEFISGEVDAMGVYLTDQLYEIKKSNKKFNTLDPNDYGTDEYAVNLYTSEDMIKNNPKLVQDFKDATDRGWEYALENPAEIVDVIKEKYDTRAKSKEALLFEANEVKKIMLIANFPVGSVDSSKVRRMAELYIQAGKADSLAEIEGAIYRPESINYTDNSKLNLTVEEIIWRNKKGTLRVGSDKDNTPLDFRVDGESQGFSIDLLRLIAERLELELEIMPVHPGRTQEELHKQGTIDLIHSAQKYTIDSSTAIISESYLAAKTVFITRTEDAEIHQLNELGSKVVAVQDGSIYHRYLKKYHPDVKIWVGRQREQLLDAVTHGMADTTIETEISAEYLLKSLRKEELKISGWVKDFDSFQDSSFHFYTENGDAILISLLNKALNSLSKEDIETIRQRWKIAENELTVDRQVVLTLSELNYLASKREISMCVLPNWPPFEWINEAGEHEGISADIIKLIEQRLNIKFRLHATTSWNESVEKIRSRECDILPLAIDLPSRRDAMLFTNPHVTSPLVIATKAQEIFIKDSSEIGQRKVGIVDGYAFIELLQKKRTDIQIVKVNNAREGLEKVRSGELWGYIDAMPVIAYMLQKHSMLELKIVGKLEFDLEDAIASRSDEPMLNQIMQKALDSISEEERRAIVGRWVTVRFEQGFDYVLFWQAVIVSVLILAVVFFWNRRLARLNKILDNTQGTLTKTSSELQTIFDHAWVGIFITNGAFDIQRMNKFAEATLFKCRNNQYIGSSMGRLFVEPADFEHFCQVAQQSPTINLEIEAQFIRYPDQKFLAKAVGTYVVADSQQSVIWLITDITDKRQQEDKLTQTLKELEIILHNVGVGIVYVKQDKILRINKAFADMLGYQVEEILGQSTYLYQDQHTLPLKPPERRERYSSLRCESLLLRSDGTKLLCENVMSLVNPQDPGLGEIWLHRDITELWRAQSELQAARDEALAQKLVAEKTLGQVASLLNNSGQGFLSFGQQLTIADGCSQECIRIFGQNIVGCYLPDLLMLADGKKREFLIKTLPLIIASQADDLRRDAYISLLPEEFQLQQRHYRAEYRLINEQQMMIILTDITDQKLLQEKLSSERSRLEFIVNALENRNELLEILKDFEYFRSETLPDLLTFEQNAQTVLTEIIRPFHTFKSLFAQANLPRMPILLHELESSLDGLKLEAAQLDMNQIKQVLGSVNISEALEVDLSLLREKLGADFFRSELTVQVPIPLIKALELQAIRLYGEKSRIVDLVRRLRYVPIEDLMYSHFKSAAQLAERQHKKLEPICLKGESVMVDPDIYGSFFKSLIHVFRNAVDHGLEDIDTRLLLDKPEMSTVQCHVHVDNGRLVLVIEDDGKGIDVTALKAKALSLGFLSMDDYDSFNINSVYRLLFSEGLSTKLNVTDISGRGVGLNAVLTELVALDGDVKVSTVAGAGTRFEFSLPYKALSFATVIHTARQQSMQYLTAMPKICDSVMGAQIGLPIRITGEISECTSASLHDFTAVVALGSGVDFTIGLSLPRLLLLEITRLFEPLFSPDEVVQLADSVGAEIINSLAGKQMVYFTHLSSRVSMSTPQIIRPPDYATVNDGRVFYGMVGDSEFGPFLIFCLLPAEGG